MAVCSSSISQGHGGGLLLGGTKEAPPPGEGDGAFGVLSDPESEGVGEALAELRLEDETSSSSLSTCSPFHKGSPPSAFSLSGVLGHSGGVPLRHNYTTARRRSMLTPFFVRKSLEGGCSWVGQKPYLVSVLGSHFRIRGRSGFRGLGNRFIVDFFPIAGYLLSFDLSRRLRLLPEASARTQLYHTSQFAHERVSTMRSTRRDNPIKTSYVSWETTQSKLSV